MSHPKVPRFLVSWVLQSCFFCFFWFFGSMGLAILFFCFFWFFHGRLQLYQTFVQADANAHVLPNQANFAHSRGSLF